MGLHEVPGRKVATTADSGVTGRMMLLTRSESHPILRVCDALCPWVAANAWSACAAVHVVSLGDRTADIGCAVVPLLSIPQDILASVFGLSEMQSEVALLVASRLTNHEIAHVLGSSVGTVKKHIEWVHLRLGVSRREEVLYVLSQSLRVARTGAGA